MSEVLWAIAEPPFGNDPTDGDEGDPLPTEIAHLVLYGDAINDAAFRDVIRAARGPRLADTAATLDPVFAGATLLRAARLWPDP